MRNTAMLAEAILALLRSRLAVRFWFPRVAAWALTPRHQAAMIPPRRLERRIGRSVARAARLLPGTSLCLPQAMAAKQMLERRGYQATIHLGVGLHAAELPGKRLHAHAWLEAGGSVVTGAGAIDTVTPLPR